MLNHAMEHFRLKQGNDAIEVRCGQHAIEEIALDR
jgi:hypothetical protein